MRSSCSSCSRARLHLLLREELAEIYDVDVRISPTPPWARGWLIDIRFSCQDDHAQMLADATRALLDRLRDGEITDDDVAIARAQLRRVHEQALDVPERRTDLVALAVLDGVDPDDLPASFDRHVTRATPAYMRGVARMLLTRGGAAVGIMHPR